MTSVIANPNKPAGLTPVGYLNGAKWNNAVRMYYIASNDDNAYYPGDIVALVGGGDANTGLAQIELGTAGSPCVGVLIAVGLGAGPSGYGGIGGGAGGPYINPNNLSLTSAPATKTAAYYAAVVDDPNVIFEIQEGGTGTNLTQTAIGLNVNFLYAAPATGVAVSGTVLDNTSAPTTTAALNLKILNLAQRVDNHFSTSPATGGGYQKWRVLINNHQYRSGVTAP